MNKYNHKIVFYDFQPKLELDIYISLNCIWIVPMWEAEGYVYTLDRVWQITKANLGSSLGNRSVHPIFRAAFVLQLLPQKIKSQIQEIRNLVYFLTAGINDTEYTIESSSHYKWHTINAACPCHSVERLILLIYKTHWIHIGFLHMNSHSLEK